MNILLNDLVWQVTKTLLLSEVKEVIEKLEAPQ